jgi:hypothetical protein
MLEQPLVPENEKSSVESTSVRLLKVKLRAVMKQLENELSRHKQTVSAF